MSSGPLSIDLSSCSFANCADDSKLPLSLATFGLEFYKDSTIIILWLLGLPSKCASNWWTWSSTDCDFYLSIPKSFYSTILITSTISLYASSSPGESFVRITYGLLGFVSSGRVPEPRLSILFRPATSILAFKLRGNFDRSCLRLLRIGFYCEIISTTWPSIWILGSTIVFVS